MLQFRNAVMPGLARRPGRVRWAAASLRPGGRDVGTDKVTKVLLGAIAAGVWVLVLLQASTGHKVDDIAAEVKAIGIDTQSIHEDMDASGDDEVEGGATRYRRD
jgi:hypothetical protein